MAFRETERYKNRKEHSFACNEKERRRTLIVRDGLFHFCSLPSFLLSMALWLSDECDSQLPTFAIGI